MKGTNIEWADHTFNPWEGCTAVGPGCDHCYAEARNARFHGAGLVAPNWGTGAPRRRTSEANWAKPKTWNTNRFLACAACTWRGEPREAKRATGHSETCPACHGRLVPARARVFCASLADVFDNEVPVLWRIELMKLIVNTPNLDWLLLTKRIGNAADMLETAFRAVHAGREGWADNVRPNVWIGATVVNQAEVDRDLPKLLSVRAAVRFLSIEPMLGPINLWPYIGPVVFTHLDPWDTERGIDWVICGGESGSKARPMHPDWARSLRDQCEAAGVPFFLKQMSKKGEVPADLMVRKAPT